MSRTTVCSVYNTLTFEYSYDLLLRVVAALCLNSKLSPNEDRSPEAHGYRPPAFEKH